MNNQPNNNSEEGYEVHPIKPEDRTLTSDWYQYFTLTLDIESSMKFFISMHVILTNFSCYAKTQIKTELMSDVSKDRSSA